MAPRPITKHELAELATEHTALSPPEADDAVSAVLDVIVELGDVRVIDVKTERGAGEGVVVRRATFDPAHPPRLNLESAAIADEGMIGLSLFRGH